MSSSKLPVFTGNGRHTLVRIPNCSLVKDKPTLRTASRFMLPSSSGTRPHLILHSASHTTKFAGGDIKTSPPSGSSISSKTSHHFQSLPKPPRFPPLPQLWTTCRKLLQPLALTLIAFAQPRRFPQGVPFRLATTTCCKPLSATVQTPNHPVPRSRDAPAVPRHARLRHQLSCFPRLWAGTHAPKSMIDGGMMFALLSGRVGNAPKPRPSVCRLPGILWTRQAPHRRRLAGTAASDLATSCCGDPHVVPAFLPGRLPIHGKRPPAAEKALDMPDPRHHSRNLTGHARRVVKFSRISALSSASSKTAASAR